MSLEIFYQATNKNYTYIWFICLTKLMSKRKGNCNGLFTELDLFNKKKLYLIFFFILRSYMLQAQLLTSLATAMDLFTYYFLIAKQLLALVYSQNEVLHIFQSQY